MTEQQIKDMLFFSEEYRKKYQEEKAKLPYHINVIDELHINENGHSRILLQLLQYKNERSEWEILQSLVSYIKRNFKGDFDKIVIENPEITQEKERIDLWVRDKKYALIFENKIYNAQDRDAQLSRYIDKTLANKNYQEDEIFIIYLSQDGSEPNVNSWGKYKKDFETRYVNLSFKKNVLPWLELDVYPYIRNKDKYLLCAIQQYIDYLKGMFNKRDIQNSMNKNLENYIEKHFEEEFNACKNDIDRVNVLQKNSNDLKDLSQAIENVKKNIQNKIYNEAVEQVVRSYENIVQRSSADYIKSAYAAVSFTINNKEYIVHISEDNTSIYCQIEYNKEKVSDEEFNAFAKADVISILRDILTEGAPHWCIWKRFKTNDETQNMTDAIKCFKEVIRLCISLIKQ